MEKKSNIVIRNIRLFKDQYKNELSFEANFTPSERNRFRRVLMCELSTIAVDKVLIVSNESVLTNEQVAHRIGLMPIDNSLRECLIEKDKCDCEKSCQKCAIYYKFDVSYHIIGKNTIYSQDIFPLFYSNLHVISLFEDKGSLSGIIKITRKSPLLHTKWSLPIKLEFKDNLYTMSADLSYNLIDVLGEILSRL